MSLRRASASAWLVLAAIAVGTAGCARARAERPAPPAAAAAAAGVTAPAGHLVLTGELTAERPAALSVPETTMWMVGLRWIEADGALVKKGQKVAEFDNAAIAGTLEEKRIAAVEAETERTRAAAEAEVVESDRLLAVDQRKSALEKARLDAAIPAELRPRREHEEKQMAMERAAVELTKAEADLAAARESARAESEIRRLALRKAQAELDEAERAIAALTLLSPSDGAVVVGDNPREKRKVQTGDVLWPGIVVARITQVGSLQAEAVLHDVDDGRVAPGDPATLVPDAFPERRLAARVADVSAVAQQLTNESPRRAFRVLLKITSGETAGLRPGLSVKAEFGAARPAAAAPAGPLPPATGETVVVKRQTFVSSVEMKGALQALDSEPIGPPQLREVWETRITMMAPEGATVKKGEPILAFDTTSLVQKLEEKKAEAESADKQIEKRQKDLALRREEIVQKRAEAEARRKKAALKVDIPAGIASAIETRKAAIDLGLAGRELALLEGKADAAERAATAELSILANRRDRARVQVRQIQEGLPRFSIAAPRDGIVVYVPNWRDEKKKVGDSCWRAEKVMDVPDISRLGVAAEVDEADSGRVAEGQRASVRLEANPDVEYGAVVRVIRRNIQRASPKNPLKVARLELKLDRIDPKMRPGMRIRGRIEIERVSGALVVPADCLVAAGQGPVVFRRRGGSVRPVTVTPGRRSEGKVEILDGLASGDVLVKPEAGT